MDLAVVHVERSVACGDGQYPQNRSSFVNNKQNLPL
jgi:hypothetical protein